MDHKKYEIIKAAEHCANGELCNRCPLFGTDPIDCQYLFAQMIVSEHPHTCYTCVHYGDGATCAKLGCNTDNDMWEYNDK